jgi:hypothetical protein
MPGMAVSQNLTKHGGYESVQDHCFPAAVSYTSVVTRDRDEQRQDVGLGDPGRYSRHAACDKVEPLL